MNDVELISIRRIGGVPPLEVRFGHDGTQHNLLASAVAIQSFTAFQRLVADAMGFWVRHEGGERGGSRGREAWGDEVEYAFQAGRKEARGK